jgi:multidrug resistance efflux pump
MKINFSSILQLENDCRDSENSTQLNFTIVNNTSTVVQYEKAILLSQKKKNKYKIQTVSNISQIDKKSQYSQLIESLTNHIQKNQNPQSIFLINPQEDLSKEQYQELQDYEISNIAYIPIKREKYNNKVNSVLLLFRKENFSDDEKLILEHLSNTFSYFMLSEKNLEKNAFISFLKSLGYMKYLIILIIALMFIPVKMNVLAPLTIKPKDEHIVTAPIDGIIKEIYVSPNQFVNINDKLIKFDTTDSKNKYFIAQKSLELSKTTLHATKQDSFYNNDSKNRIIQLQAEVKLKESQATFEKSILEKSTIYAKKSGEVIIDNPLQLIGKNISVGQKLFSIANSENIEIEIMLQVSDAIFIKKGYEAKIFLDNNPIKSYNATIENISYKPQIDETNTLAYKITANFDDTLDEIPNIGLKGTAKIYSQEVTLFFYLFRKPITKTRQIIGW